MFLKKSLQNVIYYIIYRRGKMPERQVLLEKIRDFMKKERLNFLIVFSTDKFLNEYVDLNENARYILTGFSGSTGDALITNKDVYLFVDGRYHLQADREVDENLITVEKVGMEKSPSMALYQKIAELCDPKCKIGIFTKKINCGGYRKLLDVLSDKDVNIKELNFDPVIEFSEIKEKEGHIKLESVNNEISGMSAEAKLDLLIENNKKNNIDVLVITKLEEIAYLTNLRGNDIPYSSSFRAKAVVDSEKCRIFAKNNNINDEIKKKLGKKFIFENGNFCESFIKDLKNIKTTITVGYDFHSMNLNDCRTLERMPNKLVDIKESFLSQMKAVKNASEINHMKECFLKTDIVVNRAQSWLQQELENDKKVSEKDFSDKVKQLFFEEGATGLSFEPITACGQNSAFIHYTNADPNKIISPDEIILLDCGGYFEGGYATDITRTFLAGGKRATASDKQKEIYTKVLKGFLRGINARITEETTGFDIDKKVRDIIEENKPEGFSFGHGTGHGIGLSVHESPPRISPSEFSKTKLLKGMCFTIEPGLYCDDWGGVRIENTVMLAEENSTLSIKTLTKAKLDDNLIDVNLLTEQEKIWLENYKNQDIG
jgi:Xaa-Pro aminopeptidase